MLRWVEQVLALSFADVDVESVFKIVHGCLGAAYEGLIISTLRLTLRLIVSPQRPGPPRILFTPVSKLVDVEQFERMTLVEFGIIKFLAGHFNVVLLFHLACPRLPQCLQPLPLLGVAHAYLASLLDFFHVF